VIRNIYILILSTILVTGLFAITNPETGWSYDQSSLQYFIMFDIITIDGLGAYGNCLADSPETCAECFGTGACDVVGAFRWDGGEESCIGWNYAYTYGWTTVAVMGNDGNSPGLSEGEVPHFKIYDAANGSILELFPNI